MNDVFFVTSNSSRVSTEAIVYANLLSFVREWVEQVDGTLEHASVGSSRSDSDHRQAAGAYHYKADCQVISAGSDAFLHLSDFYKTAVFFDTLPITFRSDSQDGASDWNSSADVNWSSLNSQRVVTLNKATWQLSQLLPCAARSFFACPPLFIPSIESPDAQNAPILIVCHTEDKDIARRLVLELSALGCALETYGFSANGATQVTKDNLGESRAATHIHFGHHDRFCEGPRIIDSWRSGKAVIQCVATQSTANLQDPYIVEDGANGLVATTVQKAVNCARLLRRDPILHKILLETGRLTASRPAMEWGTVVNALMSDA